MDNYPGVSLLIPSWNGLALLKQFLPSVIASARQYAEQFRAPVEILIVDDGSTDKTVTWLIEQGFEEAQERGRVEKRSKTDGMNKRADDDTAIAFRFIENESNCGFGEACNRGFAAATHRLVFLLNNDVEVSVDAIAPLVENFSDDSVFAAHCRVFEFESGRECGTGKVGGFARGFIRVHQSYAVRERISSHDEPLYSMFASGGSAMFDRQKFLDLGGFENLLAPFYWEDVEISYRAWKREYSVLYEPRSVVRHRVSSTMRKLNQKKVRRIQQRNRLIFHWINLHDRVLMASHLTWTILISLASLIVLRTDLLLSFYAALKMLPAIKNRRREEKRAAKRSDREVFDIFRKLESRPEIFVYDDYRQLKEFQVEGISKGRAR